MADKSCEVKKKKKEEEQNSVVREEHVHVVNNHKFDNTPARGLRLDHQTDLIVLRFRAAPDGE